MDFGMTICIYLFILIANALVLGDFTKDSWMTSRRIILWPIVFGKWFFQVLYKLFIDKEYQIS